ncbi:MAG TPA: zinc metalloprotease, partial [Rubricoccaceae bacterium]|nr:zinc metalloprotease [Rubricoccaceae bacterium]
MTERLPLRRAACLALLLGALAAPALRAQEAPPGRTCATPTPSEAVLQQHYEAVQAWVQQHPAPQGGETVTIPIAFHVVHNGTTGNIPDQWITDQVEVLNDAFADMGYRFVVAMLDRTENATWFSTCYGSGENPMKQALAIDPAHFLNIYTCLPSGGILGYAYLPDGDESSIHHGVVLHYNTLPGGGLFPYNQGDTGTHEVGHYVGLLHTFDGGCSGGDTPPGCETGGDRVCDTPAEASAAFGCPAGRDTCPTGGPDPIQNFMDYTDDACMNHFTPGQTERSLALMSQFRPTIMSSPDAFAAPGALAFVNVRLGESETKRVHVVNLTDDPLLVAAIETDNDAFAADATSLTV